LTIWSTLTTESENRINNGLKGVKNLSTKRVSSVGVGGKIQNEFFWAARFTRSAARPERCAHGSGKSCFRIAGINNVSKFSREGTDGVAKKRQWAKAEPDCTKKSRFI